MIYDLEKRGDSELQSLRALFRQGNKFMLLMWRLGLGRYLNNLQTGYIMVLTTTGHKSGLKRRTPVNFERENGTVYCLAGWGKQTHWYRNLVADPHCEVWLPDGTWWAGEAETVTDPEAWLSCFRRVMIRSGPAVGWFEGIDPVAASDDDLRQIGARYEVVRIRLTEQRSGSGGPGDLAWVWPLLGAALLLGVVVGMRAARRRAP